MRCILAVLTVMLMLAGCGSAPPIPTSAPPTRTPPPIPTALATATVDPVARLMGTSTMLAATDIAATHTTLTPTPLPEGPVAGWAWYEVDGVRFGYPVAWEIGEDPSIYGGVKFISPETNTEIWYTSERVPEGANWLEFVRDDMNRGRLLYHELALESITVNAEVQGEEAFFYFEPASLSMGERATLLVAHEDRLYRFAFFAGSLDAEARIFQAMLSSIGFEGEHAQPSDIPVGWEQGDNLILSDVPELAPGAELLDVSGAVKYRGDRGIPLPHLHPDEDGEPVLIQMEPRAAFAGQSLGYIPAEEAGQSVLDAGNRVRIVGAPLASGGIMPYAIFRPDGDGWQLSMYLNFFDGSRREPLQRIFEHYSPSQQTVLWLHGPAEDTLPYLRDTLAGGGVSLADMGLQPQDTVLAKGLLLTDEPKLQLAELYVQRGECRTITIADPVSEEVVSAYDECLNWERIYPAPQPVTFTARVLYAVPGERVIVLQEPVQGFITVTLPEDDMLIGQNGEPAAWDELSGDIWIEVMGELGEAGTLLAERVQIVPSGP